MCTPTEIGPNPFTAVVDAIKVGTEVHNIRNERKNAKYQMQLAYQNALSTKRQGQQTLQEGIENARAEKIKGLKEASLQKAKAAASGFEANEGTNLINYLDTIDTSKANAKSIEDSYSSKAETYFDRANTYLESGEKIRSDYNDALFAKSIGYLSNASAVASKWYEKRKKEEEESVPF